MKCLSSILDGTIQTVQGNCAHDKKEDGCEDQEIVGVKTKVCFCNKDLCNSGAKRMVTASILSILFGVLSVFISQNLL